MNKKFPSWSSMNQAAKIYKILNPEANDIDDMPKAYTVSDIFNLLPESITYKNIRGDLSVTPFDITYFSLDSDWKMNLVYSQQIPINGDIYDAFYNIIVWLKENNLM